MDSTALLSVVGGALLLSIILVTSLCTYCWGHKQPTSIHQRTSDSSPEYNSTFVLRHQATYAPHTDHHRMSSVPFPLPSSLSSPSITITKVPSCPPSENGSQASYVNQSDHEDELNPRPQSDYIIVLPDPPNPQSQESSRASSQSSGGETYINESICGCVEDSDSDTPEYENFKNSGLSCASLSSNERGSSDYVNTGPSS